MKNQISFLLSLCFLFISSCQLFESEDTFTCTLDAAFCNPLIQEDFEKIAIPVNAFLGSLPSNLSEQEVIDRLMEWMICKSCVDSIDFSCVSCLSSFPPQSRIGFTVLKDGQPQLHYMDILMSEQPRFMRVFRFSE
ncbi:MAG: hypothetical protein ACXIUD_14805 [Mongoliitalea sp.]